MIKVFISAFVFICLAPYVLLAQSDSESANRSVYNRLEYFFNSGQSDSIYNMASDRYKTQMSLAEMKQILTYFQQYGRIAQADLLNLEKGVGEYELKIGDKLAILRLGIDSKMHYDVFQFSEIQQSRIKQQDTVTEKKPEIVPDNKEKTLDFYIDSLAHVYMQDQHAKALSVGIARGNEISTFFYGDTTHGNNSVPDENSIYEIGSVTKTFTATLLAYMVEQGKLRLEDSIARFLPDSLAKNPALQHITFQSLANHTSGLPKLPSNLDKVPSYDTLNPFAHYGRKHLFAFLKDFSPDTQSGEHYEYSNLGFGLLGELMAIIANKPYGELIREVIASPLKMTNTTDKLNPKTQHLVKMYDEKGQEVLPWGFQALAGAGGLKSTIKDLLFYAQVQFNMPDSPLENAMAMTRQFTYFLPPNTDIGLAWRMNMLDDIVCYSHTGATGGCRAFIALIPDKKTALVILANSALPLDNIQTEMMEKIMVSK